MGVEGESPFKKGSVDCQLSRENRREEMLKKPEGQPEDLVKCPVCQIYLKKTEGFICISCKRGLLCKKHKIAGSRECASCVFDRKKKALAVIKEQETNLKSFLSLLQFLFLVFAVFFIAWRTGLEDMAEFLQYSLLKDSLLYIGIIAVFGYVVFYFILYSQRNNISELEAEIKNIEIRR